MLVHAIDHAVEHPDIDIDDKGQHRFVPAGDDLTFRGKGNRHDQVGLWIVRVDGVVRKVETRLDPWPISTIPWL
jgi:hypothetical protein